METGLQSKIMSLLSGLVLGVMSRPTVVVDRTHGIVDEGTSEGNDGDVFDGMLGGVCDGVINGINGSVAERNK